MCAHEGKTLPELEKKLARFFDAKGVLLVEELRRAGGKSWTKIDEFEGWSAGRRVTCYDVTVTYQTNRVRAGYSFKEKEVLHFDINLQKELQRQGVGTEIFRRAISDSSLNQVLGYWKKSENYFEGESINLLIFKEKTALGLTELEAAFETPTGKILKANGFGRTPTILLNTNDEVKILFNP